MAQHTLCVPLRSVSCPIKDMCPTNGLASTAATHSVFRCSLAVRDLLPYLCPDNGHPLKAQASSVCTFFPHPEPPCSERIPAMAGLLCRMCLDGANHLCEHVRSLRSSQVVSVGGELSCHQRADTQSDPPTWSPRPLTRSKTKRAGAASGR